MSSRRTIVLLVLLAFGNGRVVDVIANIETKAPFVYKNKISSSLRLLFAAGVEGSGHHFLGAALKKAYKENSELTSLNRCKSFVDSFYIPSSMGADELHYLDARRQAKTDMQKLSMIDHTLPPLGGLVTLQSHFTPGSCNGDTGELSYPNFGGRDKVLQYFDLRMLAEVAEAEGVDLRVVYLKRSAKQVLVSTTKHRHFQGANFMRYIRILLTDIAALHSMLVELGPGFVVCHDFDMLGNITHAENLSKFIAPSRSMANMIAKSLLETALNVSSNDETLVSYGERAVAERLQRKLDVIDGLFCKS